MDTVMATMLILEINGNHALVLHSNGSVESKIAQRGWQVGMELVCETNPANALKQRSRVWIRAAAGLAACFLFFSLGLGAFWLNTPDVFVDICINPAVRLSVNRFGKVIQTEAINQDGQALLDKINAKGELQQSVGAVLHEAQAMGYLSNAQNGVRIAVSAQDGTRAQSLETELLALAAQTIGEQASVLVQKIPLQDYEGLKEALHQHTAADSQASLSEVYRSSAWRTNQGEIWLEEIEYRGDGIIEVEFTGEKAWTGGENAVVYDEAGAAFACEIVWQQEDEWLLRVDGLRAGELYRLEATDGHEQWRGSFRANKGEEFSHEREDSAAGQSQQTQTVWIEELQYRGHGRLEVEIGPESISAYRTLRFCVADEQGNRYDASVLSQSEDEFLIHCELIDGRRYTLELMDADQKLLSSLPFEARFGYETEGHASAQDSDEDKQSGVHDEDEEDEDDDEYGDDDHDDHDDD